MADGRITRNSTKDSYWFAQSGVDEQVASRNSKTSEVKETQLQKEREERIRQFRENQEEERVKRMIELEHSFVTARKYREQQEEERKRKIEEARIREIERRQQVEERKRQIWEAEQERKEAILRRNLDREARIEARRNAQRNSTCFAFGSSTPRTFDLDLAALGSGRNSALGCSLMSAVSGRRSEEREISVKRATSACSLDRKSGDDCMTWSVVSLSSSTRGRRRTDLTPVTPRERSMTPHSASRGNATLRAVSMTRLDQLAQPRQPYFRRNNNASYGSTTNPGPRTTSPSMSKSMCNLANTNEHFTRRKLAPPSSRGGTNLSKSMLQLSAVPKSKNQHVSPFSSPNYAQSPSLRSAQSMMHLAIAPKLTRAARLRANALAKARQNDCAGSMTNLDRPDNPAARQRLYLSEKDTSRSPSRPQSSMSARSEISAVSSQASAVSLRPKPLPRKPRPISIAVTGVQSSGNSDTTTQPTSQQNAMAVSKPPRAKSSDFSNIVKKPVPPPKSAEVLAKARTHIIPTKDNLRKITKQSNDDEKNLPPADPKKSPDSVAPGVNEQAKVLSIPKAKSSGDIADAKPAVPQRMKTVPEQPKIAAKVEPPNDVKSEELPAGNCQEEDSATKQRILSEEKAKAALAEKRRIAREQAEIEAELERKRQEELQKQEVERKRQEELELKRQEEEQIRLAELHRALEEEKLRKAIEEQQQRERELQQQREEELKLKAEKEEQERKAREEAERQRIELAERIRKEELERAERKRRVEEIMSRTRNKGGQTNGTQSSPDGGSNNSAAFETSEPPIPVSMSNVIKNELSAESAIRGSLTVSSNDVDGLSKKKGDPFEFKSALKSSEVKNGFHDNFLNSEDDAMRVPNTETASLVQTNGYSSHKEMSSTSSPEERSERKSSLSDVLINFHCTNELTNQEVRREQGDSTSELINFSVGSIGDNYLICTDVVNSNILSSNDPRLAFSTSLQKKNENAITDLLS